MRVLALGGARGQGFSAETYNFEGKAAKTLHTGGARGLEGCLGAGLPGDAFATVERALDERTIGHNPERLCLMKVLCPGTLISYLPCSRSRCMDKALLWQVSLPDTMTKPLWIWL